MEYAWSAEMLTHVRSSIHFCCRFRRDQNFAQKFCERNAKCISAAVSRALREAGMDKLCYPNASISCNRFPCASMLYNNEPTPVLEAKHCCFSAETFSCATYTLLHPSLLGHNPMPDRQLIKRLVSTRKVCAHSMLFWCKPLIGRICCRVDESQATIQRNLVGHFSFDRNTSDFLLKRARKVKGLSLSCALLLCRSICVCQTNRKWEKRTLNTNRMYADGNTVFFWLCTRRDLLDLGGFIVLRGITFCVHVYLCVCACCGAFRVNFTVSIQLGLAPFSIWITQRHCIRYSVQFEHTCTTRWHEPFAMAFYSSSLTNFHEKTNSHEYSTEKKLYCRAVRHTKNRFASNHTTVATKRTAM